MKNTKKAFLWITRILERKNISYRITGGFAARVYGVNRELADIDIEIEKENFPSLIDEVMPYIIFGPAQSTDEHWDLEIMTLLYMGQDIDVCEVNGKIFNKRMKQWECLSGDFANNTMCEVYGKLVPLEPIESLMKYKEKLAREVDLEDLRQLNKIMNI